MKSKIINMADKLKDSEDQHLEELFRSPSVEDNGFSARVVRRVRQRLWLRRLSLPVAVCVGLPIAMAPATELFRYATHFSAGAVTPGTQTVMMGCMIVATIAAGVSLATD